jgi:SP family arabinose:H+ symporter-like MFS transporter
MTNAAGNAPRSIGTILIIALSGLLLGFDGSLFTGAVVFVKDQFALTEFELGWTVSSHTLSATVSIFLAGPLADRIGRRTVLRIATVMFAASAVVAAAANGYAMLIVARLLSAWEWAPYSSRRPCTSPKSRRPNCGDAW